MTAPLRLVTAWRTRADALRDFVPQVAQAIDQCAGELESALPPGTRDPEEALNLRQAARESGYCEDWLGKLVKVGQLPNAGRPHAPRILRRDLPRKPTAVARATS